MTESVSGVVEVLEDLDLDATFSPNRDQVVVAVRITQVYSTIDLALVTAVVDAANQAGFALVRETPLKDEWLLCVFDAYEDHD